MSLVVEDGSGLANAESYISVADADARHAAFGNTAWTGDTSAKEAALRRATAFMTQRFRERWKGVRRTSEQSLDWPRAGVRVECLYIASDAVPGDVANACADLALRALSEDLSPDQERGIVREKVGPLETEYDRYAPQGKRFIAIDGMLSPYVTGSGAFRELVR